MSAPLVTRDLVRNTLREKKIAFLDLLSARKLFRVEKENTLYKILQRLEKKKVITRLTGGKYLLTESRPSEFEIANFLYNPSYVSLESALSFYGILSQFPYVVTSVTAKKTKKLVVKDRSYEYSHIDPRWFFGFVTSGRTLIAEPEKALLDRLYLMSKGIGMIRLEELTLSEFDRKRFWRYAKKIKYPPFHKLLSTHRKVLGHD